jgi:hypothetical protein
LALAHSDLHNSGVFLDIKLTAHYSPLEFLFHYDSIDAHLAVGIRLRLKVVVSPLLYLRLCRHMRKLKSALDYVLEGKLEEAPRGFLCCRKYGVVDKLFAKLHSGKCTIFIE